MAGLSRVYPLVGLLIGYLLVMLANPIRLALRDGFRCIARYERVWLTFALLGFVYFIFQFATFTPIQSTSEIDFAQIISVPSWQWPRVSEIWAEAVLPAIESVAGIFDMPPQPTPFRLSPRFYCWAIGAVSMAHCGVLCASSTVGEAFRFTCSC